MGLGKLSDTEFKEMIVNMLNTSKNTKTEEGNKEVNPK